MTNTNTNTLALTFGEIARMMEKAALHIIKCDVQLAYVFTDILDESTSGEFDDGACLLLNTYVCAEVTNIIEHMDTERHLMDMLLDGVRPTTYEDVAVEYFFKWCNQGELTTQGKIVKLNDKVTVVSNDGSELNEEILINLFKDELFKLLT